MFKNKIRAMFMRYAREVLQKEHLPLHHGVQDIHDTAHRISMLEHLDNSLPRRQMPSALFSSGQDIALAMNMANNFFNFATSARKRGWRAELVLWPGVFDVSHFSDPRWEIEEVETTFNDAMRGGVEGGILPNFVVNACTCPIASEWRPTLPNAELLLNQWVGYEPSLSYLQAMRKRTLLMASGATIAMAPFADMPYVTFPNGGDLYISPFEGNILGRLMRAGWRRAHAHIFAGAHFYRFAADLGLTNTTYIPILIDTDRYAAPKNSQALKAEALHQHECDHLFFVGARHDWNDKGTGKVLAAIERLRSLTRKGFKILFPSWGKEVDRTRAEIRKRKIEDICVFLPTLSKPRLRYWLTVVDGVLDQFCIGEYGTMTLEAMAMGCPVILYYAHRNPPPVLGAFEASEICDQMLWVINNRRGATELGSLARDWVVSHHGPDAVLPKYEAVFKAVLNNEKIPQFEHLMDDGV